jgi:hypothetical protein
VEPNGEGVMNTDPEWWRDRKPNTVSRAFAEMAAARVPDPKPLAPVTEIGPVLANKLVRAVDGLDRLKREA